LAGTAAGTVNRRFESRVTIMVGYSRYQPIVSTWAGEQRTLADLVASDECQGTRIFPSTLDPRSSSRFGFFTGGNGDNRDELKIPFPLLSPETVSRCAHSHGCHPEPKRRIYFSLCWSAKKADSSSLRSSE
jgi:hypothetical protein